MRRILLVILVLLPLAAAGEPPVSPRLMALQTALQHGNAPALDDFWREISQRRTPIVEPTPDRSDSLLVTFLWRGDAGTRNVLLSTLEQREISNPDYLNQALMTRLGDSDVWYRTYRLRGDARFSYQLSPNDPLTLLADIPSQDWSARRAHFVPDPLNPVRFESRNGPSSVVELPGAPPQPWIERRGNVPQGDLHEHNVRSRTLGNERPVTVYTPAGYDRGRAGYPLLIFFDASTYLGPIPGPVILDTLTASRRLPPVVAVFVGNAEGARVRELTQNDAFETFVATELVPWIRKNYRVTSEAAQTAVIGSSIGGTAAVFSGLRHPSLFGNVLSQSGGFQMARDARDNFRARLPGQLFEEGFPEYEWLARQFAAQPRGAVKFYLEVGLREEVGWRFPVPPFAQADAVAAHRHLRDVLTAKGYDVHYREFNGGHETLSWRGSVADGLIALMGNSARQ